MWQMDAHQFKFFMIWWVCVLILLAFWPGEDDED